jgi:hypothetical protein
VLIRERERERKRERERRDEIEQKHNNMLKWNTKHYFLKEKTGNKNRRTKNRD